MEKVYLTQNVCSKCLGNFIENCVHAISSYSHYASDMNVGVHLNCLLLLFNFNQNWTWPTDFSKTLH
jgi:hypothetical protein